MLDQETLRLVKERITLEIEAETRRFHEKRASVVEQMGARGLLESSMTITKLIDLCKESTDSLAAMIWETLHRFITTAGVKYSEGLSPELKGFVENQLPENTAGARAVLGNIGRRGELPNMAPLLDSKLQEAHRDALRKIRSEIDLFVLSLKNRAKVGATATDATIFNIYSPVGAIQTGGMAVAIVAQEIDTETRNQLGSVLKTIEDSLKDDKSLPTESKSEVIELVQDAKQETRKNKPNRTRLRAILGGIAQSIAGLASLKPAYETLMSILSRLF